MSGCLEGMGFLLKRCKSDNMIVNKRDEWRLSEIEVELIVVWKLKVMLLEYVYSWILRKKCVVEKR